MMKRMLTCLLLCVLCIPSYGGTKRALVVCVGAYPSESGWNTLASQNDKALVLDLLDCCGYISHYWHNELLHRGWLYYVAGRQAGI